MLWLSACTSESDCATADSVQALRQLTLQGRPHTLVLRTSGLQDKLVSYELHAGAAPPFDTCGRAAAPAVSSVLLEPGQPLGRLVVSGQTLRVVEAGPGTPAVADPAQVPVDLP